MRHESVASPALSDAHVETQPRQGKTWKRGQPIIFDTTGANAGVSRSFTETPAHEETRSGALSRRRLQVTGSVVDRGSANPGEPQQKVANSYGGEMERCRLMSQAQLKATAAHRAETSCERAAAQFFRAKARVIGPAQRKKRDTRGSPAAETCSRKQQADLLRRLLNRDLYRRSIPTTGAWSGPSSVRGRPSEEVEHCPAADYYSDSTRSATFRTATRGLGDLNLQALFERVIEGYSDVLNTLRDTRPDCPDLKVLWTYMTTEILNMQTDFLSAVHQYRTIARIAQCPGRVYQSEGVRWTSSSWRRRVRVYYLTSPFVEQRNFDRWSIQALWEINRTRNQQGLVMIQGGRQRRYRNEAIDKAGRDFLAFVKQRDALATHGVEKETRTKLGPVTAIIDGLEQISRDLRSIVSDRARLAHYNAPISTVHQGLHRGFQGLRGHRVNFIAKAHLAEVAVQRRILRRLTKSAVEQNLLLSGNTDAPVRSSPHSHRPLQQTLNFHGTAALNNAHLGGPGVVQPTPESLFDLGGRRFEIAEDLRKATLAASASGNIYWQYDLYQGPAGERVKVHYCRNKESSDRIAKLFLDKSVIGFDIEWKPQASAAEGTRKNVSLIQLASEERIALFHIARFGKDSSIDDLVPPNLKMVMETPDITKVGVAVKADCTRLRKFMGIEARGLLELSHLYKLIKFSTCDVKKINKSLVSLAQQVEEHLLLPMWKGEVRSSDWSQELSFQQVQCKSLHVECTLYIVTTNPP